MRAINLAAKFGDYKSFERNDIQNVHLYIAEPADSVKIIQAKNSIIVMVDNIAMFEVQRIDTNRVKIELEYE